MPCAGLYSHGSGIRNHCRGNAKWERNHALCPDAGGTDLSFALVVAIIRTAQLEEESALIWGLATVLACFLCRLLPFPYIRVLIAGVVIYVAMTAYKMAKK